MSINTIKATIQMRRGLEQDFDADQMTAGEWAVSTDKKYVRMCFAPGIVVRMATYEGFEQDMQEIQTILAKCEAYASEAADYVTLSQENAVQSFDFSKESGEFSKVSKSYAVGGTGTRTNENIDNAKYYYEQAKSVSESLSGALRPMGTVTFANLPALSNVSEGDMYNISDKFTTNENFKEGSGHVIPAGSNVYKTADEKWDVLAGTPVSTVNGQTGDVNITKDNIGLGNVDNTADSNKYVKGVINKDYPNRAIKIGTAGFTSNDIATGLAGFGEEGTKIGSVNKDTLKQWAEIDKVGNYKAVSTEVLQGLSDTEKSNARANIDAFSKNGGLLQGNLNMEENDIYDVRTIYSPSIPIDIMSGDDNNGSSISLVNRDIKVKYYENGTSKEFNLFPYLIDTQNQLNSYLLADYTSVGREITDSWAEIKANVNAGNVSRYRVGDYKKITINGGYTLIERILGINTYSGRQIQNGYLGAHIDFASDEMGFNHRYNATNTNNGTGNSNGLDNPFLASELRQYMEEIYNTEIPDELKSVISMKQLYVEKRYSSGGTLTSSNGISSTTYDIGNLWLPTEVEVIGYECLGTKRFSSGYGFQTQYPLFRYWPRFRQKRSIGARPPNTQNMVAWWLLNADDGNSTNFAAISWKGYIESVSATISATRGIPICFRIQADTYN